MSDPHHKRESEKYDNPIPSREYILSFVKKKPVTKHELYDLLKVDNYQKKPLTHRLRAMVRDQQLSCNRDGVYRLYSGKGGTMTGTIIANPKGFGFIALDKGGKDLRLSANKCNWFFMATRLRLDY